MRARILLLVALSATAASWALADSVVRKNGALVVGRIVTADEDPVKIRSGDRNAKRTIEIRRSDIDRICTSAEEFERIVGSASVDDLTGWAAAYHAAGSEIEAILCMRHACSFKSDAAEKSAQTGGDDWKSFCTKVAVRFLGSREHDAPGLLRLARRARHAGLAEDVRLLVSRAFRIAEGGEAVRQGAAELGVSLPMTPRVDLEPALFESLEADAIHDEGQSVAAEQDKRFLAIPVRYDPRQALTLSRATLRGRDARWLYGLRRMRLVEGRATLDVGDDDPIFERMDVQPDDGIVVFRNSSPPRRAAGEPAARDRGGPRERRYKPSGWVAVVIEIPRGAAVANIQLADHVADELDLTFVRRLRESAPAWPEDGSVPEAVTIVLERIQRVTGSADDKPEPRRATGIVALRRLGQLQAGLGENQPAAWNKSIRPLILAVAESADPDVSEAAWRFVSSSAHIGTGDFEELASAPPKGQLRWAALIERCADPASPIDVRCATAILEALLRSRSADACDVALDELRQLAHAADWYTLARGSTEARKLALGRLDELDPVAARDCISALVAGIDSNLGKPTADAVRRLGLAIRGPNEPVLAAWERLADDRARAAYLSALGGPWLDGVWHCPKIATMALQAGGSDDATVRGAVAGLIRDFSNRQDAGSARAFPMLVPREADDPLVTGLASIARAGDQRAAIAAVRGLLQLGYAEEAQRALGDSANATLIDALTASVSSSREEFGLLDLLASWTSAKPDSLAQTAVARLAEMIGRFEEPEQWQAAAAIKSGINIESLNELSFSSRPGAAGAALRVLYAMAHMTPQERQRVAGMTTKADRLAELRIIDRRRGQLVDGRYGVLAIMETTTYATSDTKAGFWSEPQRRCILLPDIHLDVNANDDTITASCGGKTIGRGITIPAERMQKSPAYYYGVLEAEDGGPFVLGPSQRATEAATSQSSVHKCGPLLLPDYPPSSNAQGGEVTIQLADLKTGSGGTAERDSILRLPSNYEVTVRYHTFGGYVGCGARIPLPKSPTTGQVHLLNIMLVIERLD